MEAEPWKTPNYDLRGKQLRYGDVGLRTHVVIFDNIISNDNNTGNNIKIATHRNYEKWDLIKYKKLDDGEQEYCFSLATIVFNDSCQGDYKLVPVGNRLICDINGKDLKNLKKILSKVDDHCCWMRGDFPGC